MPSIAGIASVPARRHSLQVAIASIWQQVDHVEVVLNGYDSIPEWLRGDRITITMSQEVGDHADNAKFLGMRKYDDCIYFAIDDDIEYPSDYVARMHDGLVRYGDHAVVGVHGAFIPQDPRTFFDRRVACFWDDLAFDMPMSYVGTGTIAMHRNVMPASPLDVFTDSGMSDLYVATHLKSMGTPVIGLKRSANWLKKIPAGGSPSLWQSAQADSSRQDALLRATAPWGTRDVLDRCRGSVWASLSPEVRLAIEIVDCISRNQKIPTSLREDFVRNRGDAIKPALFFAEKWVDRMKIRCLF